MSYTLPNLPYNYNALEPIIDAKTMEIHHTKHHAGYVNKLNAALETQPQLASKSIEELISNLDAVPENIRAAVRNNGGGHANHSLFWTIMRKGASSQPSGQLAEAINQNFQNFDNFKKEFQNAANNRFGSGWAWLSVTNEGKLVVESTPNQDNPIMHGNTPILGLDVWEHAYYLNYQNKRPDYVEAFMGIINWEAVARNYEKVQQLTAA